MTGKFLRKIGRDKQHEQHKKLAYMGKEEVGRDLVCWQEMKEGKVLESGMLIGVLRPEGLEQGSKRCREKAYSGDKRRPGHRESPFTFQCSAFAEVTEIPENGRVECAT
jgi:hypothetical protein